MRGSCKETFPGSGIFRLRWDAGADPKTGRRRQDSATVKGTKQEADRELARRVAAAGPVAPARQSLADFLQEWLAWKRPSLSPTTVQSYENQLAHLTAALGTVPLARLTARQIDQHYSRSLGSLSASSIGIQHCVLGAALRQARKWGLVPYAVTDDVSPPRGRRSEKPTLDAAELRILLETAEGTPLRAPLLLACLTGLRRGELLGLQWGDIDRERRTLRVERQVVALREGLVFRPPKSAAGTRTLALGEWALAALAAHESEQEDLRRECPFWQEAGLVFPREDGTVQHPGTFASRFGVLVARAGLPRVSLHSLRRSSISLLARAGAAAPVIQARSGHASARQTLGYMRVLGGQEVEAAVAVEEALRGRF